MDFITYFVLNFGYGCGAIVKTVLQGLRYGFCLILTIVQIFSGAIAKLFRLVLLPFAFIRKRVLNLHLGASTSGTGSRIGKGFTWIFTHISSFFKAIGKGIGAVASFIARPFKALTSWRFKLNFSILKCIIRFPWNVGQWIGTLIAFCFLSVLQVIKSFIEGFSIDGLVNWWDSLCPNDKPCYQAVSEEFSQLHKLVDEILNKQPQ
jgi:hypothetical protein